MVNLGNPDLAFRTAMRPNDGVGLARMEFIISEQIGIHPMALVQPEKVTSAADRDAIAHRTKHHASPAAFFVETLAEGVGTIAAAFYPKPVIVRLSDFKTNEYARLIGGANFEPKEENPMIGFRGASRYAHPAYAPGFALECAALRRVREVMGLQNLRVMVPFCRRVEEARLVIAAMAENGLTPRRARARDLCHVRDPQQRDPDRRLRPAVRRLLHRIKRSDSAHPGRRSRFRDRRLRFRRTRPRHARDAAHGGGGRQAQHRHIGICGEAPADYPEIARFVTEIGIDSISVNPGSVLRTMKVVGEAERACLAGAAAKAPTAA